MEEIIQKYLLEVFFDPLLQKSKTLKNILENSSPLDLLKKKILEGEIVVDGNRLKGVFSSNISKIIKKELNGKWLHGSFKIDPRILKSKLGSTILRSIEIKKIKFKKLEKKLDTIKAVKIPKEFSKKIEKIIDKNIQKTSANIRLALGTYQIEAAFTDSELSKFKKQYLETTQRPIVGWIQKDVEKLRSQMKALVTGGSRYSAAISTIKKRKNITLRKARFLARQETNLLTASLIEKSYTSAGVSKYIWRTTPAKGYPRKSHAKLEGKIFKFSDPPKVNARGDRRNPGEDYQCRCWASAIVDF